MCRCKLEESPVEAIVLAQHAVQEARPTVAPNACFGHMYCAVNATVLGACLPDAQSSSALRTQGAGAGREETVRCAGGE